jgi:N-acylneuraminate cytidylyltransferase
LKGGYKKFLNDNYDSLLSVVREKKFMWSDSGKPINYNPKSRPRRQDFKGILIENGAFYITKRVILENVGSRLGGKIGMYEMDVRAAVEIDEVDDWNKVESLLELIRNGH